MAPARLTIDLTKIAHNAPQDDRDMRPEYLFPNSSGVKIIDASSDHTVVDITGLPKRPRVGNSLAFQLGYFALSRLMISPDVRIEYR